MNFIRKRIIELEKSSNLSERKLSIELGYNPSYLKEIKSGRSNPSLEALLNICEYFNITPLEFFDTELTNPVIFKEIYMELKRLCNDDMDKFLNILKNISPSDLSTFIHFINKLANNNIKR